MDPLYSRCAAAMVVVVAAAGAARAELPPWVYAEDQRQAPLLAEIRVERSQTRGQLQVLQARVLGIRRQSLPQLLRPGALIEIVYSRPPARSAGWAGPSPVPLLAPGSRSLAWLSPLPTSVPPRGLRGFAPAAGGRSFGPSLEDFQAPPAPASEPAVGSPSPQRLPAQP